MLMPCQFYFTPHMRYACCRIPISVTTHAVTRRRRAVMRGSWCRAACRVAMATLRLPRYYYAMFSMLLTASSPIYAMITPLAPDADFHDTPFLLRLPDAISAAAFLRRFMPLRHFQIFTA